MESAPRCEQKKKKLQNVLNFQMATNLTLFPLLFTEITLVIHSDTLNRNLVCGCCMNKEHELKRNERCQLIRNDKKSVPLLC